MTIILGKCERNKLGLKSVKNRVKVLEEIVAGLKAENVEKDKLIMILFEFVQARMTKMPALRVREQVSLSRSFMIKILWEQMSRKFV